MFSKTYHATHPDMMSGASNDQLRDRYLVGEMFLQGGRYDQTFRFWRPLAEGGTPGSPWVGSIRRLMQRRSVLLPVPEGPMMAVRP